MFFVVFVDEWCASVPESWINSKLKTCRWPPKGENPTNSARKEIKPRKNWNTLQYSKVIGPYRSFEIARAVEIAAVDISTSDEASMIKLQNVDELAHKRNRKIPARYQNEPDEMPDETGSSDEEDKGIDGDNETSSPNISFGYEPPIDGTDEDGVETQPLDYGDFFKEHSTLVTSKPEAEKTTFQQSKVPLPISYAPKILANQVLQGNLNSHKNIHVIHGNGNGVSVETSPDNTSENAKKKNSAPESENINDNYTNINNVQVTISSPEQASTDMSTRQVSGQMVDANKNQNVPLKCSGNCCATCSLKLDTLLRLFNTYILNNEHPRNTSETLLPSHPNLLPNFPLINLTQLNEFNTLLRDNEAARTQYVRVIQLRHRQDANKHTRDILGLILSDEFCRLLSWTGQKQTIKVKDMEFVTYLTETIIAGNSVSTIVMVARAIQMWLQHCGDRLNYRMKKNSTLV